MRLIKPTRRSLLIAAPAIIVAPSLARAYGYGFEGGAGGYNSAAAGAGYTGPGDIFTFTAWGGLRAYSAAAAAAHANAIDIVDSSGTNPATITVLSSGDLDYATLATWITAHGTASIKTLYDQTGNGFNAIQATVSKMPIFVLSPTGISSGRGTMQVTTATSALISSGVFSTLGQPYSGSVVEEVTTFASGGTMVYGGAFHGFIQGTVSGTIELYGGTNTNMATAALNAFHAVQGLGNGASSFLMVDGTPSSPANIGATSPTGQFAFGNNGFLGNICEGGFLAGDQSVNFSSMNSNQRSYWGF